MVKEEEAEAETAAKAKAAVAMDSRWTMAGAKEQSRPIVPTRKRAPDLSLSHLHHSQEHR